MPRFSENEKEMIKRKLTTEGEKLFASHGLKKATIDELIGAAGIAKASFYTFYQSKEYLYMDIVQSLQQKVFSEVEAFLGSTADMPGRERVKQVFGMMYQSMLRFPILSQIDPQTVELLARRVSQERMADFHRSNLDAAQSLADHGVRFAYDTAVASGAFRSLYLCWIHLQEEDAAIKKAVMDILLNGVIDKIVLE